MNQDKSADEAYALINRFGLDANARMIAQTLQWRTIGRLARIAVRLGSKNAVLAEIAWWEDCTPLHCAAYRGKANEISMLLVARADPRLRNTQALTAEHLA